MNGSRHRHYPVVLTCDVCEIEFDGEYEEEYGQGWTSPEECPKCGNQELEMEEMDELDVAERKAEARGEDF